MARRRACTSNTAQAAAPRGTNASDRTLDTHNRWLNYLKPVSLGLVFSSRFRIAWLMAIVAIAALNLTAIRAASDSSSGPEVLLCMVVLTMTNVLAMVLLIGHGNRGCRRLLIGFEVFGVRALAYLIVAILSGEDWVWSYVTLVLEPTRAIIRPIGGGKWSTIRLLVGRSVLSVWSTLPQLAFALAGGLLFHWFGTADRRDRTGC